MPKTFKLGESTRVTCPGVTFTPMAGWVAARQVEVLPSLSPAHRLPNMLLQATDIQSSSAVLSPPEPGCPADHKGDFTPARMSVIHEKFRLPTVKEFVGRRHVKFFDTLLRDSSSETSTCLHYLLRMPNLSLRLKLQI